MKTIEKEKTPPQQENTPALTKKEQKQLKKKEKKEGRRIRTLEPINSLMPFLMKTRSASSNLFEAEFDTEAADAYITKKRKEGLKGFSMMHDTFSFLSVTTGTTCFLIIALDALRYIIVDDKPDIRLINTHTERNCRNNHINLLHQEGILIVSPGLCIQSCMIWSGFDTIYIE